jgi:hypothetical protein
MTLLADGRGGVVRASLLGAARALLAGDRSARTSNSRLTAPTVTVDSPHGRLTTVPPPVLIDGRSLSAGVVGYGSSPLAWIRPSQDDDAGPGAGSPAAAPPNPELDGRRVSGRLLS